jgi:hypothetical protein
MNEFKVIEAVTPGCPKMPQDNRPTLDNVVAMPPPRRPARRALSEVPCQVFIFPGVRRERHELDLGARLVDTIGKSDLGPFGLASPAH